MKITVEANNFCPDDCPQCEIECETIYAVDDSKEKMFFCKNSEICKKTIETVKNLCVDVIKENKELKPVVHGHWELRKGFNKLQRCSACGYEYNDLIECDNYCGNCGAKMDGEEDG